MIKTTAVCPGYIPPKNQELLSSWLFRLSREHCIPLHSFTKFYLPDSAIWNRDLDKWLPINVIRKISSFTPLSTFSIKQLQLRSYEGIVFEDKIKNHYTDGITNIGIFHRQRKLNGLLICPNCLKQKEYFQKSWRLISSLICLDCNLYLIDCCPHCNSPIAFHRLEITRKNRLTQLPIYICYNCHQDLSIEKISCEKHDLIMQYQKYINKTIWNGTNDKANYSFLYFKVIFLIMKQALSTSNIWYRIREGFEYHYSIKLNRNKEKTLYYHLDDRRLILPLIYHLLQNWPNRFLAFCNKYNIRYADFSRSCSPLPYWFYSALKTL